MAGLADPPDSDPTLPTYRSATGIGKMVMYLTYQIDGVQNNAPMLGSFTSLYTKNDLISYYENIKGYVGAVANSIITLDDITAAAVPFAALRAAPLVCAHQRGATGRHTASAGDAVEWPTRETWRHRRRP